MTCRTTQVNILVTLDEAYIPRLNVMLASLLRSNPACVFDVYLLHTAIRDEALDDTKRILGECGRLIPICTDGIGLDDAPVTARYPKEIYYRIFAARYLPETLDRVLYLDPDLVVNASVLPLYEMPLDAYYFAAASHTGPILQHINSLRLDMDEESPYINSGVMLMNLERLRKEQNYDDVFSFIESHRNHLILPDQDIISALYGSKIFALDTYRYNMTEVLFETHAPLERGMNLDWVRENAVIIHYCGRNKPWKSAYIGRLDIFYREAEAYMKTLLDEAGI